MFILWMRQSKMSTPTDSLHQLESIEQQISAALQSAGSALIELSKDKPGPRIVENHSTAYMKALDAVESGLSTHINYLTQCSTGQPHEGSCYASQNDLHMARFRWEHVRSRLTELEKMKTDNLRQQSLQRSISQQGATMKHSLGYPSAGGAAAGGVTTPTQGTYTPLQGVHTIAQPMDVAPPPQAYSDSAAT